MEFWNNILTEKSWEIMQQLKKENFRFIVIGGWAAYLWTKQHKSKDINIILPNITDLEILKQKFDLRKNDNLKKYEIKIEDINIDIYVQYYSKLALPVEEIIKDTTKIQSFEVVSTETLLTLKQGAELDRKDTIKGQKDRIDIITLLCYAGINFEKYRRILHKNKKDEYRTRLKQIITTFSDLKHINLNVKEYSATKKELLEKI